MAIPQETAWVFGLLDPATNAIKKDTSGNDMLFVSPPGFVLFGGFVLTDSIVSLNGWARYVPGVDPSVGTSCDIPTPPDPESGAPVWVAQTSPDRNAITFNISQPVAGTHYDNIIPDYAVVPATGQTYVISGVSLPPYLSVVYVGGIPHVVGEVPLSAAGASINIILLATQTDGKATPSTFTTSIASVLPELYSVYDASAEIWKLYVNPLLTPSPGISFLYAPESWDNNGPYSMLSIDPVALESKIYPHLISFTNPATGDYDVMITGYGPAFYGHVTLIDGDSTSATGKVSLSTAAPVAPDSIGPVMESTIDVTVPDDPCASLSEVAYQWNAINTGTTPDSLGFYYKGTATHYKFYLESETTPGQFDLYNEVSSDPSVTLSGGLSRFNHMIVSSMGSRVWHGHSYEVKLEILEGSTVVKTVTFAVSTNNNINSPITGYLCS